MLKNAVIILLVFCASCAQIVSPGGGPRDLLPPKAVKYSPDSAALNFNAKRITILFNEYIRLKDVNGQLIISPPMKNAPDIREKGKSLIIDLNDTLKPGTTYTFNFGKAVTDLTEGNAAEGFQYIFSTGTFIDSVSVRGKVTNAFDLKPEKDVLVMLYNTDEITDASKIDSLPYKKLPGYFAKTKEDGSYRINHIHEGHYKVFALKDGNSNYLFDSPDELIDFKDDLVELKRNDTINFSIFKEAPQKQFLKRTTLVEPGHILFVFNKPVDPDLEIRPLNFMSKKEWKLVEYSQNRDSLNYWLIDVGVDTLKLLVKDKGMKGDTVDVRLAFTKNGRGGGNAGSKPKLTYRMNVVRGTLFDLNKQLTFEFNHPLKSMDQNKKESVVFMEDSGAVKKFNIKYDPIGKDDLGKSLRFVLFEDAPSSHSSTNPANVLEGAYIKELRSLKEDKSYKLFIPPGTYIDVLGLPNDTIRLSFKTNQLKSYGNFKLILTGQLPGNNILLLLDEKENIIQKTWIGKQEEINFDIITPGNYKIKMIIDENNDNKWTTGNYQKKQHPEKVIYYPGTITIRANWDLEQEWKVK